MQGVPGSVQGGRVGISRYIHQGGYGGYSPVYTRVGMVGIARYIPGWVGRYSPVYTPGYTSVFGRI